MAEIGIVKGEDFAPDERLQAILADAVAIGNAYARANTVFPRDPSNRIYGPDSEWVMAFADKNTTFLTNGALNADARLWMHYNAIVVTPAMAVTKPGIGSDYGIAGMAKGAEVLDGSKTYKLTLPEDPPAKDFWAITLYDTQTRSIIQTDQKFPTLGSQTDGIRRERRRLVRHLFRTGGTRGPGRQLAADHPRQELVHHPAHVRPRAGLDRPDLAAR